MKRINVFLAAMLTMFAGSANAFMVHDTCTKGVSPSLKLMCHIGHNEQADLLIYYHIQGYCHILGPWSSNSLIVTDPMVHDVERLDTGNTVGCPDGYYSWTAVTRYQWDMLYPYTEWEYHAGQGSYRVFVCGM